MNKRVGLVFAGGGGKGAYQIGVWKALKEFGVDRNISSVSGTSVGALNAILFGQGDYEIAENVWLNITSDDILSLNIERLLKHLPNGLRSKKFIDFFKSHGFFSREGLINIMERYIDFNSIFNLDIFACCSDVTEYPPGIREASALMNCVIGKKFGKKTYFRLNDHCTDKIQNILLASSALPFIFDTEEIDGRIYHDGGLCDNAPIKPIYDAGCKIIIVIHLSREYIIDCNQYPDAQILEIIPQESQGNLFSGTLDFTSKGAQKRIEQGYNDAIRILKPIYQMALTQVNIKKTLVKINDDELKSKEKRSELLSERENLKNDIDKLVNSTGMGGNT